MKLVKQTWVKMELDGLRYCCSLVADIWNGASQDDKQRLYAFSDLGDYLSSLSTDLRDWCLCRCVSPMDHVVIGGCGRSGTNLLRSMLCAHHNLCGGPETNLMVPKLPANKHSLWLQRNETPPWVSGLSKLFGLVQTQADAIWTNSCCQVTLTDNFAKEVCAHNNKPRWVEKTPKNVGAIQWILDRWPNAKFIHIVRDGRDVACSLRNHPKWNVVDGQRVPTYNDYPIDNCIGRWVADVSAGIENRGHPRYYEMRYEDLVHNPKSVLKALLRWLGEPWDHTVLDYTKRTYDCKVDPQSYGVEQPVFASSIGRWKCDLSDVEKETVKQQANRLLVLLGYVSGSSWR